MGEHPIACSDVAKMMNCAGADEVITVDLHHPAVLGFFDSDIPVIDLDPLPLAADYYIEKEKRKIESERNGLVVVSMDSTQERV